MGLMRDNLAGFGAALDRVDGELAAALPFGRKVDELMRFALSIKGRSAPCVRKHFRGARAAGASDAEIAYVFALTMRESAGADECWTAAVLSELQETGDTARSAR